MQQIDDEETVVTDLAKEWLVNHGWEANKYGDYIKKKTNKKHSQHNKRISQVPFYMFKQILSYKAPLYGKEVKTVNPYMTSQTDSQTGKWKGERKGCRFYSVNNIVYDADWNAAINIAKKSVKHPISYKVPYDGALNILNRQVDVNLPKVSKDNFKHARP